MELGVRVAVVPTLGEAEVILGLLETEGIQAMQRAARGGESHFIAQSLAWGSA